MFCHCQQLKLVPSHTPYSSLASFVFPRLVSVLKNGGSGKLRCLSKIDDVDRYLFPIKPYGVPAHFQGDFHFHFPAQYESTLKAKNLLPKEQFFCLKCKPLSGRVRPFLGSKLEVTGVVSFKNGGKT